LVRNEVYAYVQEMFSDPDCFHARSQDLTRHLHHTSQHPRIKNGEFYVVRFRGLLVDGESREAIGLFKSEHKEPYLKVQATVAGNCATVAASGLPQTGEMPLVSPTPLPRSTHTEE
jgi:hypothetical protein